MTGQFRKGHPQSVAALLEPFREGRPHVAIGGSWDGLPLTIRFLPGVQSRVPNRNDPDNFEVYRPESIRFGDVDYGFWVVLGLTRNDMIPMLMTGYGGVRQ